MIKYAMTISNMKKILTWDKRDYNELVASFSEDEIQYMIDELDDWGGFDICSDYWEGCYDNTEGRNCDIVLAYTNRLFYDDIESREFEEADKLYEIIKAFY